MIILLTGLPGVGKGTQADYLTAKYNIEHVSTGNIFRNLITQDNELSKELNSYISKGKLVPDELTIKILKDELKDSKYENGFLLDGFPRTVEQAKYLDNLLKIENLKIDYIINLDLEETIIKERLSGRMFCPKCQSTFHSTLIPPKVVGICDKCGGKLIQREDDKIDKIEKRLEVAQIQTLPVIEYYGNLVSTIDIEKLSKQNVFNEIIKVLND